MEHWDRRLAGWDRSALVVISGLIFLSFLLFLLPAQAEQSASYSAQFGSPDTTLLLPVHELYEIADGYGSSGRSQYIRARWTFDVLFPLAYGFFFFSAINFSMRRLFRRKTSIPRLSFIALAALAADLSENAAMSAFMSVYPEALPGLAALAVGLSTLKWLLVTAAMLLALGGLVGMAGTAVWRKWLI